MIIETVASQVREYITLEYAKAALGELFSASEPKVNDSQEWALWNDLNSREYVTSTEISTKNLGCIKTESIDYGKFEKKWLNPLKFGDGR